MRFLPRLLALRFVVAGAGIGLAGTATAQEPAAAGPIIELPTVIVTDSRDLPPPEKWRYAEIPGFEILTNASDKSTQKLIRDFQRFNFAIDIVWPGLQPKSSQPIPLIICGRGGKFDVFVPGQKNGEDTGRVSLFLQEREQVAIVLDFEAKTIRLASVAAAQFAATDAAPPPADDDPIDPSANSGDMEIDSYKQLYREYIRYLLSRVQPHFPAWFEEGLAQLFMGMTYDERTITFAKLEDSNLASVTGGVEDSDFNKALEGRALMPLPEMFAVERGSATALNPLGSIWAKQSQAFVHMCLYGNGQRDQKGFITFLLRLQKEPLTEQLFKECFKRSYRSMLTDLRSYQHTTAYKSREWRMPKGQTLTPPDLITLRDATPSEIGRMKGDALRLAGHPEAAHTALVAPYIRGERDPNLLAALGLEEHAAGHDDRAEKFLAVAVAAKVGRPRAYLELARFRYQASLANVAATGDGFTAEQVSQVLTPLVTARKLSPPLPEIYELMSETLMRSANVPKKETIEMLFEGVNLFPGRLGLVYQTAVLSLRAGGDKGAAALIEHGLRVAPNENSRARFAELKAELPPAATTPAAAPPPVLAPKR